MSFPLRFLYINDDERTVTCVLPSQYSIFSVNPFEIEYSRENFGYSLSSAVTCQGYRFFAFSGLPADPDFDTRQVCIFDHEKADQNEKEVDKIKIFSHKFDNHILSMRITPLLFIAAFHHHCEIWDINQNKPLRQINTTLNIHAPLDVNRDYQLLAIAGSDIYSCDLHLLNSVKPSTIRAADETVSMVKFSRAPGFLATTSLDGKVVRVFDTNAIIKDPNGSCIGKFKRGSMASVIHSIDFSPDNQYMAIVSQNGTLHFFDLRNKKPSSNPPTYKSIHKISIGQPEVSYIVWFSPSLIVAVTVMGMMISISIDDGNCHELGREQIKFLPRLYGYVHD